MKVLLVITGLGMGGAENVVVNLADELVKRGHTVKIAYLTGPALVLPANPNVEVISIGMTGAKSFLTAYFKLRNVINKFQPNVVHSHMVHANILSRLMRLTVKMPKLICTVHSTYEGGRLRMLAYRLTDKLADISTNVSEEAVAAFVSKDAVKPGRMLAVANGIDTVKFSFNSSERERLRKELKITDQKMLLAVGRLDTEKDYPNLLNAIYLLKKKRQDFKVFIVGDGPLKSELIQLLESLQLADCVEFLGIRRDVAQLMSAADVFVLSSAWEGFGLVVAEAMACERVVVATDCGGVKEVVGDAGVLVSVQNPVALVDGINTVLDMSEGELSKEGAAARENIIGKYSLGANTTRYIELYLS